MEQRRFLEVALGVYVATLLVPAAALAGWESGAVELSAGVFVAAVVGLAAHAVDDLADRLCSQPVASGLMGLPLVALLLLIFVVDLGSGADIVAVGAMVAMILGIITLFGASATRTRRLREQATEIVAVSLGETDGTEWKQLQTAGMAVVGIGMITAGAATIITGDVSFSSVIAPLGGLSAMIAVVGDNGGELVVTDSGLIVDQSVIVWDDLAGYRRTDDKIRLVRSEWYLPDRRFDRAEMDDEALIEGLGGFLPRVDEQGRVERMARN